MPKWLSNAPNIKNNLHRLDHHFSAACYVLNTWYYCTCHLTYKRTLLTWKLVACSDFPVVADSRRRARGKQAVPQLLQRTLLSMFARAWVANVGAVVLAPEMVVVKEALLQYVEGRVRPYQLLRRKVKFFVNKHAFRVHKCTVTGMYSERQVLIVFFSTVAE